MKLPVELPRLWRPHQARQFGWCFAGRRHQMQCEYGAHEAQTAIAGATHIRDVVGDAEFTLKRWVTLASRIEQREGEPAVRCSFPDLIASDVQTIASYVQIEEAVQFREAWPIHLESPPLREVGGEGPSSRVAVHDFRSDYLLRGDH